MRFTKGHGTGNDFVVIPDLDGDLVLSAPVVEAICNRHTGIGADGVLRVVRSKVAPDAAEWAEDAEWFMDYRNADGSIAEMCGNGVRVYARYLVTHGLAEAGALALATRGGIKHVTVPEVGDITVDMGAPELPTWPPVKVAVGPRSWEATHVSMGNPHLVCEVGRLDDAGSLLESPVVTPASAFPTGVNVEFVVRRGARALAMRVFERGVGETQSCGTGACAVAVAVAGWSGDRLPVTYDVAVPGGALVVTWTGETVLLTGPAELVAEGEIDPAWLSTQS